MAVTTLTIPSRSYAVGTTTGQRSLPGTQQYSTVTLTVDCTGWVSALTTLVKATIWFSYDNQATWKELMSLSQINPPPYLHKNAPADNIMRGTWGVPIPVDPTHLRGSIEVAGQAVSLGDISLSAS